jgi:hypothetical protein
VTQKGKSGIETDVFKKERKRLGLGLERGGRKEERRRGTRQFIFSKSLCAATVFSARKDLQ